MELFSKAESVEEAVEWLARQYFVAGAMPVRAACSQIADKHAMSDEWLFELVIMRTEEIGATVSYIHDELSKGSAHWN